jgi:hypothetical protein
MNQIDILVFAFVLFGGWLGSLKGRARAFTDAAGTVVGFGLASLYSQRLASLLWRWLQPAAQRFSAQPAWVAAASTHTNWQQAAYSWLDDLLWPDNLKRWIASTWQQLSGDGSLYQWGQVVEQAFWQGLANVCSFLLVMILVKLVVAGLAHFSLRLAMAEKDRATWPGFAVGVLQSALLVFLLVALAIPFLILGEQAAPMLQTSITVHFVTKILETLIVI